MRHYDAVIIGAGPGGYEAALELGNRGVNTLLIERSKERVGGTCLNEGCIPAKLYLETAGYAARAEYFRHCGVGVEISGLELKRLKERKTALISEIRSGVLWMLERSQVELLYGDARFVDANTLEIGGEQVGFDSCIIATGSTFREIPGIPLDGSRVISSREAFELEEMPESVAVIGGGAIGCEFASFFAGFGTEVTMVVRRPGLLPSEDEEAAKALLRAFRKRGITVLTSSTVEKAEVTESGVTLTVGGEGAQQLSCDLLLCATGRLPHTKGVEPEKAGITLDAKGFVAVDETFRTAQPHIFAIGDCINTPAYAHTAAEEGRIAARNLIGASETNRHLTPSLIFSHPQLASCGLSEQEAAAQGRTVEVRKAYFKANSKAKLMGDDSGVAKVLLDPGTKTLLGATITGVEATEIIHELLLAIEQRLTLDEVKEMIHGHPTVSEIVRYL